jgi:hypothetical protein
MIKVAAKPPPERMAQSKLSSFASIKADDSHGLEIQAQVRSSPQGQVLEHRDQYRHDEG